MLVSNQFDILEKNVVTVFEYTTPSEGRNAHMISLLLLGSLKLHLHNYYL